MYTKTNSYNNVIQNCAGNLPLGGKFGKNMCKV